MVIMAETSLIVMFRSKLWDIYSFITMAPEFSSSNTTSRSKEGAISILSETSLKVGDKLRSRMVQQSLGTTQETLSDCPQPPSLPASSFLALTLPCVGVCLSGSSCLLLIYTCVLYLPDAPPLLHVSPGSRRQVCSPRVSDSRSQPSPWPRPKCDFPRHHSAPVQHMGWDIHPILNTQDSAVEPAANTPNPRSRPTHISPS